MTNDKFKDATIKLFLRADKGRLIRLVNSIRGTNYPEDIDVSENTLDTPVFMAMHNDLSFCYDNDLNLILIEHQSTINENMPLRMLMYLGRVYEKLTKANQLYATRRISLPAPHFIVLYNGTAECPDIQTMKLSESFGVPNQEIELTVQMYNINYNEANMPYLLEKNPELMEYAAFIQRIREYRSAGTGPEDAIKRAIGDFQHTNVMGNFLDKNASEVVNMLMAEWDTNEFGKVQREEGRLEGFAEGIASLSNAIATLIKKTGQSFDQVVDFLDLSDDEIEACRPHYKGQ